MESLAFLFGPDTLPAALTRANVELDTDQLRPAPIGGAFLLPRRLQEPFLISAILGFSGEGSTMRRRWTSDEISKLKSMAQKHPAAKIAEELGRGISATFVKAHGRFMKIT
jgi:hypothetical protein